GDLSIISSISCVAFTSPPKDERWTPTNYSCPRCCVGNAYERLVRCFRAHLEHRCAFLGWPPRPGAGLASGPPTRLCHVVRQVSARRGAPRTRLWRGRQSWIWRQIPFSPV